MSENPVDFGRTAGFCYLLPTKYTIIKLSTQKEATLRTNIDMYGFKLPKDFLIGTANSAFQSEGAWDRDGKSMSMMDHYSVAMAGQMIPSSATAKTPRYVSYDTPADGCFFYDNYEAYIEDMAKTGQNILALRQKAGLSVKDLQDVFGFATPQAIYKWLNGRALPSTENLLILSRLLNVPMEDMLVVEQSLTDRKRKKEWDAKHPPAFMAYRIRSDEAVREVDVNRFCQYLDFMDQERLRVSYSF